MWHWGKKADVSLPAVIQVKTSRVGSCFVITQYRKCMSKLLMRIKVMRSTLWSIKPGLCCVPVITVSRVLLNGVQSPLRRDWIRFFITKSDAIILPQWETSLSTLWFLDLSAQKKKDFKLWWARPFVRVCSQVFTAKCTLHILWCSRVWCCCRSLLPLCDTFETPQRPLKYKWLCCTWLKNTLIREQRVIFFPTQL